MRVHRVLAAVLLCGLVIAWPLSAYSQSPQPSRPISQPSQGKTAASKVRIMDLQEVFVWRTVFADLLGKSKDAVVERFGDPASSTPDTLEYTPSLKSLSHGLLLNIRSGKVIMVKVYSLESDELPVTDIIKRAPLFTFESGTFEDSPRNYFLATTKDGRNAFQFEVSDTSIHFAAAMFTERKVAVPEP